MLEYASKYPDKLTSALFEHLYIVGVTLLISILLAAVLTIAIMKYKKLSQLVIGIFGAVYSIPSLALFAMLIPVLGIGSKTAITVLVVYNQFLLIRNFIAGFESVDPAIVESAVGMGLSPGQILWKIQLPLMFPVMMAGINLAVISTIGIATIAATINAGGIGALLFDGLRTLNTIKILWGTILSAGLALSANLILSIIQKVITNRIFPYKKNEGNNNQSIE